MTDQFTQLIHLSQDKAVLVTFMVNRNDYIINISWLNIILETHVVNHANIALKDGHPMDTATLSETKC